MWGAGVDEPHVFGVGGACGVRSRHRVRSMSHHEESTVVIVFGVGVVVCEVLACGSLLTSLLSALVFAVAELPAIVVGKWHCLLTLFGMEAPLLPKVPPWLPSSCRRLTIWCSCCCCSVWVCLLLLFCLSMFVVVLLVCCSYCSCFFAVFIWESTFCNCCCAIVPDLVLLSWHLYVVYWELILCCGIIIFWHFVEFLAKEERLEKNNKEDGHEDSPKKRWRHHVISLPWW